MVFWSCSSGFTAKSEVSLFPRASSLRARRSAYLSGCDSGASSFLRKLAHAQGAPHNPAEYGDKAGDGWSLNFVAFLFRTRAKQVAVEDTNHCRSLVHILWDVLRLGTSFQIEAAWMRSGKSLTSSRGRFCHCWTTNCGTFRSHTSCARR